MSSQQYELSNNAPWQSRADAIGDSVPYSVFPEKQQEEKESTMADVTEKDIFDLRGDVKDARYDVIRNITDTNNSLSQQVDAIDDTLSAAINTISRDTMDVRAQVTGIGYQVRDGFTAAAKDAEINALKTQVEMAKQSTYLSDKIDAGNSKTQDLINELKNSDLNRYLIERNAELVEERHHGRHWRGRWDEAQFQAVNSRLQALDSQFSEARQGMVNFGTMAGVGQTSTNNNVK